jgi:urease accessory protein
MADPSPFLASLQLADSALPIGRFVHSYGLEAWLRDHEGPPAQLVAELVQTVVCEAVAPLDGVLLAHAHRGASIERLTQLDACLTARKLTPSSRHASVACGRKLASLGPSLARDDRRVTELADLVHRRDTDGNLAIVEGALTRALGIAERDAVLIELRGAAASLLSAAVRLGAVSPTVAQIVLADLARSLHEAATDALARELDDVHATTPEIELYALAHTRAQARLFST